MSLRALFGPVTAVVASTTNLILMCLAVYLDYYDGSNTRLFKTAPTSFFFESFWPRSVLLQRS